MAPFSRFWGRASSHTTQGRVANVVGEIHPVHLSGYWQADLVGLRECPICIGQETDLDLDMI